MRPLSMLHAGSLLSALLTMGTAVAEEVLVAVASNFTAPMQELAEQFELESGHQVQLAFGSSGRFYAQIVNGAPYQLFFSADQEKPRKLEEAGLSVSGSRFTYAIGSLVLWSRDRSLLVEGPEILDSNFNRLALANPELAPYGRAAVEVLESLGKVDATRARWVQGENIAQTYQFVETGNAQLGFVAKSQVFSSGQLAQGSGWVIPPQLHNAIRQDAVLLNRAADCRACQALINFIATPQAAEIIRRFGYNTD
ncbi:MAG: molybdate ABC transporter substrate-binding protein [Gammaproteobacteria bacterium]